jgi:hypothetical protein
MTSFYDVILRRDHFLLNYDVKFMTSFSSYSPQVIFAQLLSTSHNFVLNSGTMRI